MTSTYKGSSMASSEKEQQREGKDVQPMGSSRTSSPKSPSSGEQCTGSHAKHHSHGIPGRKHAVHDGMVPAVCPVSGHSVSSSGVHADTPHVLLKNGQRIFACSTDCLDQLRGDVHKYLTTMGERWTEAPDMFGLTVACPECKSRVVVNDTTPRLQFKHGQTLWFSNYTCLTNFLKSPSSVFGTTASAIASMVGLDRDRGLQAACPITGKKFNVDERTHFLEFANGQRIYCCSEQCTPSMAKHLIHYLRGTHDHMVHSPQPSLCGLVQKCVCCEHNFTICDETTPRVQFHGGQNLYFSTNTCLDQFLENPIKYLHSVPVTLTHTVKEFAEIVPKETATATGEKHKAHLQHAQQPQQPQQPQPQQPQQPQQLQQSHAYDVPDADRQQGSSVPIHERFSEKTGGARVTPISGEMATGSGALHKEMEKLSIDKDKEKLPDKDKSSASAATATTGSKTAQRR